MHDISVDKDNLSLYSCQVTVREIISRFFLLMLTETEEIRAAEKKGNERDLNA